MRPAHGIRLLVAATPRDHRWRAAHAESVMAQLR
jgi:hypothetical protein